MPEDNNQSLEGFISAGKDINVEEIMASIHKRIREKKDTGVLKQVEIDEIEDMELQPLPDFLEVPNVYQPHLYPGDHIAPPPTEIPEPPFHSEEFQPDTPRFEVEEGAGVRGLVKKFLALGRKILMPLVRFMTRPLFNELKQEAYDRHNGLKSWAYDRNNKNAFRSHKNAHNIEQNHIQLQEELAYFKPLIQQSKEYIKLLHNTINNLIVETSKLKIEEGLLKTKLKVLEDKIEFLENRERAIEQKLFPQQEKTSKTKKKKDPEDTAT